MTKISKYLKEKGQGLTEYVLILAFIAGIAFMIFGGNGSLKGTVAGTLTETVRILAGLFDEEPDWGHLAVNATNFNDSNQSDRLKKDQKALENIARFFLTKTRGEVQDLLNIDQGNGKVKATGNAADNNVVTLGWLVQNDQGGMDFVFDNTETNGTNVKSIHAYLNPEKAHFYNWVQGDYGNNGTYSDVKDNTNKYFVSDYPLQNGWTHDSYERANGVRLRLHYGDIPSGGTDSDRPVVAAKIAIDPGSQKTKTGFTSLSKGLEVGVRKDGDSVIVNTSMNDNLSPNFNFTSD